MVSDGPEEAWWIEVLKELLLSCPAQRLEFGRLVEKWFRDS